MMVDLDGDNGQKSNDTNVIPIAVVGFSCRFPGNSTDGNKFWDLLSEGKSAYSKVPSDRFNVEAFHHLARDRLNTTASTGAHFLNEDISTFDAPFFNMPAHEARATDPQQRILLEVAYEALENAGIPMENVAGSDTSCYVGCFTKDWSEMILRDPETSPKYIGTGGFNTMLSNRVSWFFDLHGPSMTVDTACSSSLVCLHLACQSIRCGESKMALVGGSNLMLGPDMNMWMSNLGFFSKDGLSKSFDAGADGYGRGEGFAFVVLKPLATALQDGDLIRAVVRNTGMNQDGKTTGLTLPSSTAQADLIRSTYRAANLDLDSTHYVEAHGTGTSAGDPLELAAIAETLSRERKADTPVLVGSVKTNIGHLEGAAGLAGVIKAILILEKGIIPPNLNLKIPNPNIPFDSWKLRVPVVSTKWPAPGQRRISVNSFGFGGANAHAILDDSFHYFSERGLSGLHNTVPFLSQSQEMWSIQAEAAPNPSSGLSPGDDVMASSTRQLFVFSTSDRQSLLRLRERYVNYLLQVTSRLVKSFPGHEVRYLRNLAFTLARKRSRMPWKSCVTASSLTELCELLSSEPSSISRSGKKNLRIAFVFTGQGAQWPQMGCSLLQYPVFRERVREADVFLKSLGCSWSALEELRHDTAVSNINQPEYSQPLCTILQIALVDLFSSWKIKPSAVVGHSSGEIAAAYTVGALSKQDAWKIAFFRGRSSLDLQAVAPHVRGAMIAIGASEKVALELIHQIGSGQVVVACINSPVSITLSGDESAVDEIEMLAKSLNLFARKLKVQQAYHSPHMEFVGGSYMEAIKDITARTIDPKRKMHSSVIGKPVDHLDLGPEYWVQNSLSKVRFTEAVESLLGESDKNSSERALPVDCLLEIGPHSTLQGPLSQILRSKSIKDLPYCSVLSRGKDGIQTVLECVQSLFVMGANVDIARLNALDNSGLSSCRMLTTLPSYTWNHTRTYWHESRVSKNFRFREHPRMDLIGAPVADADKSEPKWRGFLRTSDMPWIRDHEIQSSILYPAAGMITMALEAARQISDPNKVVKEIELREIYIDRAAVVPDDAFGLECILQLRPYGLRPSADSVSWYEFRTLTCAEGEELQENCRGLLAITYSSTEKSTSMQEEERFETESYVKRYGTSLDACDQVEDPMAFYNSLSAKGAKYGRSFRNITWITQGKDVTCCEIEIPDTKALMPEQHEFPHLIHPATLDAMFQTAFAMSSVRHTQPCVPTFIRSLRISADLPSSPGSKFKGFTTLLKPKLRGFDAHICMLNENATKVKLIIQGLRCSELSMQMSKQDEEQASLQQKGVCGHFTWIPAFELLSNEQFQKEIMQGVPPSVTSRQTIAKIERATFAYIIRALHYVSPHDIATPHLKLFYQWMLEQREKFKRRQHPMMSILGDFQYVPVNGNLLTSDLVDSTEGEMISHIGGRMNAILTGKIDPLQFLLDNDLLYRYYQASTGMGEIRSKMSRALGMLAHTRRGLSILEVGAGNGGTTYSILSELCGNGTSVSGISKYTVTDVTPAFFERAQASLTSWSSFLEYKVLDIDSHPKLQGFPEDGYDVVVAANVLHATSNIDASLAHVQYLLRPGGKFCLIDYTNPGLAVSTIYGCLPGWWKGEADGRYGGPTLSAAEWASSLDRSNFNLDFTFSEFAEDEENRMTGMIATRQTKSLDLDGSINQTMILEPSIYSDKSSALANEVQGLLNRQGHRVERATWPVDASACKSIRIISLLELEDPFLATISKQDFSAFQQMILQASSLVWVTKTGNPMLTMYTGLVRSARNERPNTDFVSLTLSSKTATESCLAARLVTKVALSHPEDTEYVEGNGLISVCRLEAIEEFKDSVNALMLDGNAEEMTLGEAGRPLKLEIGSPGMLDTLYFGTDESTSIDLLNDEIEIRVRASGLNFRDVMVCLSQIPGTTLGWEASGIVARVGRNVTRFRTGDRICTWCKGTFRTHLRSKEMLCELIPEGLSFEEAAAVPLTHGTVYQSLINLADVKEGQSILIHAAAGGVGQVAIQYAQHLNLKIFATAGTPAKRQLIRDVYGIPEDQIMDSRDLSFVKGIMRMTNGQGVNYVLNSLSGEALRQTWHCIAPFGLFIELGIKDILNNTGLDMQPFLHNARFASVNLERIEHSHKFIGADILKGAFSFLRKGITKAVKPLTIYPVSQIESAFRTMQAGKHIGKIVISFDTEENVPVYQSITDSLVLKHDATFVIAGGYGGLGRSLAILLAQHGARNLAVISRSGGNTAEARKLIHKLEEQGVRVRSYPCDIGNEKMLGKVIQQIKLELPPIRGVIQSAMVLRDTVFENMSYQDWGEVIGAKVQGSWNLHLQFRERDLDFFIMLSSIAGVTGNPGQANYAAGGAFQDALAYHRRLLGLRAVTVDLGYMIDIGYVAEKDLAEKMRKWESVGMREPEFHGLMRTVMKGSYGTNRTVVPAQVVTGYATGSILKGLQLPRPFYFDDPRFATAAETTTSTNGSRSANSGTVPSVALSAKLANVHSITAATEVILEALIEKLAHLLQCPSSDIDADRPLHSFGVDSLVAVEIRNWISKMCIADISLFTIMRSVPMGVLALEIAKKSEYAKRGQQPEQEVI